MGHEAFELDVRTCAECFGHLLRGRTCAETPHPGVDLQMTADALVPGPAKPIEFGHVFQRVKNRRQTVVEHGDPPGRQEVSHHQNSRLNIRLAQRHTFLDVADREQSGALGYQDTRNLDRSMTVAVGFDHRHDFDRIANGLPNAPVVRRNAFA